jgi:hypothetical protein
MGGNMANSTAAQQDLNNVDLLIAGLQDTMAQNTLKSGISLAGAATGSGALTASANSPVAQYANLSLQSDRDLTDALSAFAKASTMGG